MPAKIYKDSVGIGIELDTKLTADLLAAATLTYIEVMKPGETTPSLWGSQIVEGTGRIKYYPVAGDLAVPGVYTMQAVLEYGASCTRGNTVRIRVYDKFQ